MRSGGRFSIGFAFFVVSRRTLGSWKRVRFKAPDKGEVTVTRLIASGMLIVLIAQGTATSSVVVRSENAFDIKIETIAIDAGGQVVVRSSQRRATSAPFTFHFVADDRSFIRFSYAGVSPRTYSTRELASLGTLDVTNVEAGGELLALVPRSPVRPIRLSVEGPGGRLPHVPSSEHLSIRGLAEGAYRVIPIYQGDVFGSVQLATIRRGNSTILVLPSASLGEAIFRVAPDFCNAGAQLHIQVFGSGPGLSRPVQSCETELAGLRPGSYRATLRHSGMSIGPVPFSISAQSIATVTFPSPEVMVSGTVTSNGRPLEGASVTYFVHGGAPTSARRVEARTDRTGFYQLPLNRPGNYRYLVSHPQNGLSVRGMRTILNGRNQQDIGLSGGRVRVALKGLTPRARVTLHMEDERGRSHGTYELTWESGSSWQPVFEAVPFGRYRLAARTGGPRPAAADEIMMEITATVPDLDVSLEMKARR
jgi:hypothetical protein